MTDWQQSRRQFLTHHGMGIGSLALAWLMNQERLLARPSEVGESRPSYDTLPRPPHYQPRAKAMISLFQHGGPSHMDLLDPKPELSKHHGQEYSGEVDYSFQKRASKKLFGTPWKFARRGESGVEVSELLPHLSEVIDEICVIRSMHTGINGHGPCIRYMNTGTTRPGRPALGSWMTYGLGSESRDLPAYVVLTDPGGLPVGGTDNWSNGWLPSIYQGTVVRPSEPRILNLNPPDRLRGRVQDENLRFLQTLNEGHRRRHPGEPDLQARIASYELAANMQTAATEALDLSSESEATREMYGLNDDNKQTREYGARCLIARRMVERGVRFVQLFINGQIWDNHRSIESGLKRCCKKTDKPTAALLKDLRQRGLLEETLVHWGGEIGRLPVVESHGDPKKVGRDHNGQGFTMWLAGGGIKGGMAYGATDEFGHRAVENPVSPNDYHATLLHLFGLDHERLTFSHNQRDKLLTAGREARVVKDILA